MFGFLRGFFFIEQLECFCRMVFCLVLANPVFELLFFSFPYIGLIPGGPLAGAHPLYMGWDKKGEFRNWTRIELLR